jgi:hypothetical protein
LRIVSASRGFLMNKDQPPQRTSVARAGESGDRQAAQPQFGALLMTDGGTQRAGPRPLFRGLTEAEKARVLGSGKRKVLRRFVAASYLSDRYRPELHYMRGPGPKSLAKTGDR